MRIAGQGSNWIRRSTRLAIYARDGHRCMYCNRKVYAGRSTKGGLPYIAHLDHVMPCELGGSSKHDNLVTCCQKCNDRKQAMSLRGFLALLASEGVDVAALRAKVRAALATELDRAEGRRLAAAEDKKYGVQPGRRPRKKAPKTARTARG